MMFPSTSLSLLHFPRFKAIQIVKILIEIPRVREFFSSQFNLEGQITGTRTRIARGKQLVAAKYNSVPKKTKTCNVSALIILIVTHSKDYYAVQPSCSNLNLRNAQ